MKQKPKMQRERMEPEVRDRAMKRGMVHDRRVTKRTLRELIDDWPRIQHVRD